MLTMVEGGGGSHLDQLLPMVAHPQFHVALRIRLPCGSFGHGDCQVGARQFLRRVSVHHLALMPRAARFQEGEAGFCVHP